MNKFNLTFSGKILTGKDPAQVKLRFGKMFAIDDPVRLERFFTGQTIILRRNLERKAAAQYFHELHLLGAVAALVKVIDDQAANTVDGTPASSALDSPKASTTAVKPEAAKQTKKGSQQDAAEQVWAVSSKVATRKPRGKKARLPARDATEGTLDKSQRDTLNISARVRARKEKTQRLAEEATVQKKAEQAEQQLRTKEENDAARRKAQHEQEKAERAREKAEKAAQRKAALKEKKRLAAEEAARLKAEQEEKQRRAAEEAARLQAEREEKLRREAEKAARLTAEREEKQRKAAEEAARLQAEQEEKQRRAAEKAARLQAELEELKRLEDEEAARLQAELEEIKHQEAEELARIKADAMRKQVEAERKSAERLQAATGKRTAQYPLREQEKSTAALQRPEPKPRTPQQTALKPARASVKTSLETPRGNKTQTTKSATAIQRKRQPGEPNLYQLRPFRNTAEVHKRSELALHSKRRRYTLGVIALAAMLITGGLFFQRTAYPVITGASAIAIETQSGPALLAGDSLLFHDRAGIGTGHVSLEALGLRSLGVPLAFDSTGALLAPGLLVADDADSATGQAPQLLRCDLKQSTCQRFSPARAGSSLSAFVIHPMDGSVLLADAGQLVKLNRDGEVVAQAAVTLPDHPVLRLHAGLLFVNSAEGPGVSVYRYEDSAFGKQLDEILLLPPAAVQAEQSRVGDFLFSGGAWWASLLNPESGSIGLYRFDDEWNNLGKITLLDSTGPLQLTSWGEKTLVNDLRSNTIQRYSAKGRIEAPFVSSQLRDLITDQQRRVNLVEIAWRCGLLLSTLIAILGFALGYLQSLRQLVYKPCREHGAEPVDDYADTLQWIDPIPNRRALLRHRTLSYSLLALATLILAVAKSVTVWQLAALLLALCGPGIALLLLGRHPIGHIGTLQGRLLLVDHGGMYHLAGGSDVQYRGPFLLIDDVVIFSGSRLLPAFSSAQIQTRVRPLATGGIKVDRNTVLVKLLQSRHPLALGAIAILTCSIAAAILLCLQVIF